MISKNSLLLLLYRLYVGIYLKRWIVSNISWSGNLTFIKVFPPQFDTFLFASFTNKLFVSRKMYLVCICSVWNLLNYLFTVYFSSHPRVLFDFENFLVCWIDRMSVLSKIKWKSDSYKVLWISIFTQTIWKFKSYSQEKLKMWWYGWLSCVNYSFAFIELLVYVNYLSSFCWYG